MSGELVLKTLSQAKAFVDLRVTVHWRKVPGWGIWQSDDNGAAPIMYSGLVGWLDDKTLQLHTSAV